MTLLCGADFIGRRSREIFMAGLAAFARAASPGMTVECEPTNPRARPKFTHPYPFCPSFAQGVWGARFLPAWVIAKDGVRGGSVETCRVAVNRSRPCDFAPSCSALSWYWRFRPPAWVLPISALNGSRPASPPNRTSVTEADLARNIDRDLISYRSLVRITSLPARKRTARRRWQPKPEASH
jgi:hypothetical protein